MVGLSWRNANRSLEKCQNKKTVDRSPKHKAMALSMLSTACLLAGCNQDSQVKSLFFGGQTTHADSSNAQSIEIEHGKPLDTAIKNVGFQALDNPDTTVSNEKAETTAEQSTEAEPLDLKKKSLTEVLNNTQNLLTTANTLSNINNSHLRFPIKDKLRENVSQQFLGVNDIEQRLMGVLPEIEYDTADMSTFATKVNNAEWSSDKRLDPVTTIKIQALLNWHNHGVGAVDGRFAKNTIKAMQTFQKARGIKPSKSMNEKTWNMLTADSELSEQPVLIKYTLKQSDITIPIQREKNMQYRSVREAVAEKFHMSQGLLKHLNPKTKLRAGNTIIVYNPGQPNLEPVKRVEVYKRKNLLVAYTEDDKIVASYPTTIGSNSPSGTHYVANRLYRPHYNNDFSNKDSVLPPGPNNPVGLVWMGLTKPSFGIHGSPDPEMISRQISHGCVRLTNWDALSLYGTMQHKAKVEFKES